MSGAVMQDPLTFALGQLDRLHNFFPRLDGKAAALFAINAGMMGIVALNFPYATPKTFIGGLGSGSLVVIGLSLWHLFRVFFPDTVPAKTQSVIYFDDIARIAASEYAIRLRGISEDEMLSDAAFQVHRNAEILSKKYAHIQTASVFTAIALVLWVAFLVTLTLTGAPVKTGA